MRFNSFAPIFYVACIGTSGFVEVDVIRNHGWAVVGIPVICVVYFTMRLRDSINERREAYDLMVLDTLKGLGGGSNSMYVFRSITPPTMRRAVVEAFRRLESQGKVRMRTIEPSTFEYIVEVRPSPLSKN